MLIRINLLPVRQVKKREMGRQIVGVINFPPKQIGPFVSEFLLTGFSTEEGVVVTAIERPVPDGTRLA